MVGCLGFLPRVSHEISGCWLVTTRMTWLHFTFGNPERNIHLWLDCYWVGSRPKRIGLWYIYTIPYLKELIFGSSDLWVVEVTSQAIPAISCIDLDEEEKPEKKSDEAHVPSWELTYCWWTKSCTSKDDDYPIIYRVLTIPGGVGFCPSTVSHLGERNILFDGIC